MPQIIKTIGNYIDILNKMFPGNTNAIRAFSADSKEIALDLLKDLPRQPFLPSRGRTYSDHVATWLNPNVSKAYTQGNMTASFFSDLIYQDFVLNNDKFIQQKTKKGLVPHDADNRITYVQERNTLCFAYYDQEGIPCGVSITYSKLDPELWSAAIIRNTCGNPLERDVLHCSPADLVHFNEGKLTSGKEAAHSFLQFLHSEEIKNIFKNKVFFANGTVNITHLNHLGKKYQNHLTEEELQLIHLKRQQEHQLREWHLDEDQFAVLTSTLVAKQKQNRHKIDIECEQKRTDLLKSSYNSDLEAQNAQPFIRRHAATLTLATVALFSLVSLALVMSGVLAPLGFALSTSFAIWSTLTSSALVGATVVGSGIIIAREEEQLSTYKANRVAINTDVDNLKVKKLEEIGKNINVSNNQESITRVVLAADFNETEFDTLQKNINNVGPLPKPEFLSTTKISKSQPLTAQRVARALWLYDKDVVTTSLAKNKFALWATKNHLDFGLKEVESELNARYTLRD